MPEDVKVTQYPFFLCWLWKCYEFTAVHDLCATSAAAVNPVASSGRPLSTAYNCPSTHIALMNATPHLLGMLQDLQLKLRCRFNFHVGIYGPWLGGVNAR
ncbi:unnamed protein product [Ceratitis capitata]|uniref:(Mediterranean fruit fly) hypothetical protein n=1 Tax=Ceratitis capitata TaxID=7213 RepID=A0A811U2F8_CERCA|nr:unnamed protein product [Ceratitis capitata]